MIHEKEYDTTIDGVFDLIIKELKSENLKEAAGVVQSVRSKLKTRYETFCEKADLLLKERGIYDFEWFVRPRSFESAKYLGRYISEAVYRYADGEINSEEVKQKVAVLKWFKVDSKDLMGGHPPFIGLQLGMNGITESLSLLEYAFEQKEDEEKVREIKELVREIVKNLDYEDRYKTWNSLKAKNGRAPLP